MVHEASYVLNISFQGKGLKHFERNTKSVLGTGWMEIAKTLAIASCSLLCIVAVQAPDQEITIIIGRYQRQVACLAGIVIWARLMYYAGAVVAFNTRVFCELVKAFA